MRVVIQRTKNSSVSVNNMITGESSFGLTLLVCLEKGDTEDEIKKASQKILAARIFQDGEGKMNQNIQQVEGTILAISQFTLSWRGDKGNRPSFDRSMPPKEAQSLFDQFCQELAHSVPVEKGEFRAEMEVSLINQGPVTFVFDF